MIRSIFGKTLYERRWFILGWTLGMVALAMLMASFFPAMRQQGGLDALVENMPPAFQGLIGNLTYLRQFDTYIASQLFDIRVPLIAGVMSIILGLGLSIREEESGELRTLVALPISRTKLLFEKWAAMICIVAITALGLMAGVYIILPFLSDASIDVVDMIRLVVMTFLVMATYGTITFVAGVASGKRAVAMLVGVVTIIGSFLLTTFSAAVDWLQPYEKLSLLHYFPAVDIIKHGINWRDVTVFIAVMVLALIVAWVCLRRRDLE